MAAIKKKKFFPVEIPLTNSTAELLAYSIDQLNNRTIKLDLTRQLRGKSIEVLFKIQVQGEKIIAEPTKLTLLPFFIRRMLRKGVSYVEDSFSMDCKDAQIRVKPFLITRKKVSHAVRKALREQAKDWLQDELKNKPNLEIFKDIIDNNLQKPLSLKLKKIYPLALYEIRILQVEKLKEQEKLKVKVEKIKDKAEIKEEVEETKKEKPAKEKEEKTEEKETTKR